MVLISQALLLASTLALANAQTINKDGKQLGGWHCSPVFIVVPLLTQL